MEPTKLETLLLGLEHEFYLGDIPLNSRTYIPVSLADDNQDVKNIEITDPSSCEFYIKEYLQKFDASVAYGGYLERRNLYDKTDSFTSSPSGHRNIHLGIDFWAPAGTDVYVPLAGTVHSFKNNTTPGDYGPTIVLEHNVGGEVFYSLYGHLASSSLTDLVVGKSFQSGALLATLGTPEENVNYAPHLHFQLIVDMQDYKGDYPGVCAESDLDFYKSNCPDPNLLLKFP